MPNFTSPGEIVRYQGSDAQIICGQIIVPAGSVFQGGTPGGVIYVGANGQVLVNPNAILAAGGTLGLSGNLNVSGDINRVNVAGTVRAINLQTYVAGTGKLRWQLAEDGTAEGGADAGSDLKVSAFTDAAVVIDVPLQIIRAAGGLITLGGGGRPITLALTNQGLRINGQVDGAGALLGTLANAPSAGDPDFWIPVNVAGVVGWVPWWHA